MARSAAWTYVRPVSFDTFVHWTQSVLGILTSIVTLIAGVFGLFKVWPVKRAGTERRTIGFRPLIALILILIGLLILIVWLFSPRVAITEPADGGTVDVILHDDTGSAEFRVSGTATRLTSNSKRRIYLLVHPDEPPAPGWWIQPAVSLDSTGWTGVAWIGTRGWEARTGQRLWLQAVVAARRDPLPTGNDGVPWVGDPQELQPATTSKVVHATIRSVSRP